MSLVVEKEVAIKRFAICKECPKYNKLTTQCSECKCFMKIKTKINGVECPLKKW